MLGGSIQSIRSRVDSAVKIRFIVVLCTKQMFRFGFFIAFLREGPCS